MGMSFSVVYVDDAIDPSQVNVSANSIFVIAPNSPANIALWQEQIRSCVDAPKFLLLTGVRSERLGRLQDDVIRTQMFPMLPSEIMRSIGILSGLVPDDEPVKPITRVEDLTQDQLERRGTKKLLVVEDNEINQIVIQKQLELLGYSAEVAQNGSEALILIQKQNYDVVLTDCHMPVMDGFEMSRKIREFEASEGLKRVPIIAITANALKGDADKCFAAGMDDYIAKPIEVKKLDAKLNGFLDS